MANNEEQSTSQKPKSEVFLERAHTEMARGNSVMAIENYLNYIWLLKPTDDVKLIDEINVTKVLLDIERLLVGNTTPVRRQLLVCYLSMIYRFPRNPVLLNATGLCFYVEGQPEVARTYFHQAAGFGYLPGEKNFIHCIWQLIPRWHFRMLNDDKRNLAFQRAITKAVDEGFIKVCDIGTGCGLLSLIAAKGNCYSKIIAFEESKILSKIAKGMFDNNKFSERIKVITKNSNKLESIPEPCTLLVTEIFDAVVFGEHCLKTIHHALTHFVEKKSFKMIPERVKLYVTAFQSSDLYMNHKWVRQVPELGMVHMCLLPINQEPYDSEYLKNFEIKYLTLTESFLEVDFYNKTQIAELLAGNGLNEIILTCCEDGIMHGFAVWFDLKLDQDNHILTDPENEDNLCWEQGVFYLNHPILVKAGDVLRVKPRLVDNKLGFNLVNYRDTCGRCIAVNKEIISVLNDERFIRQMVQAANSFPGNVIVLDMNTFPLFGLLLAKKGAIVYYVYKNNTNLFFIQRIMAMNGLPRSRARFLRDDQFEYVIGSYPKPNIMVTNFIQMDGSWTKPDYPLDATQVLSDALKVPRKIELIAVLIQSDYLDTCNMVDDNKALNFGIAYELNLYTGNEHPSLGDFNFDEYSTPVTFDVTDDELLIGQAESTIIRDGTCNAILYWFEMHMTRDVENKFSTLDSTHFKRISTLLRPQKSVKTGEVLTIRLTKLDGFLKVSCD